MGNCNSDEQPKENEINADTNAENKEQNQEKEVYPPGYTVQNGQIIPINTIIPPQSPNNQYTYNPSGQNNMLNNQQYNQNVQMSPLQQAVISQGQITKQEQLDPSLLINNPEFAAKIQENQMLIQERNRQYAQNLNSQYAIQSAIPGQYTELQSQEVLEGTTQISGKNIISLGKPEYTVISDTVVDGNGNPLPTNLPNQQMVNSVNVLVQVPQTNDPNEQLMIEQKIREQLQQNAMMYLGNNVNPEQVPQIQVLESTQYQNNDAPAYVYDDNAEGIYNTGYVYSNAQINYSQ